MPMPKTTITQIPMRRPSRSVVARRLSLEGGGVRLPPRGVRKGMARRRRRRRGPRGWESGAQDAVGVHQLVPIPRIREAVRRDASPRRSDQFASTTTTTLCTTTRTTTRMTRCATDRHTGTGIERRCTSSPIPYIRISATSSSGCQGEWRRGAFGWAAPTRTTPTRRYLIGPRDSCVVFENRGEEGGREMDTRSSSVTVTELRKGDEQDAVSLDCPNGVYQFQFTRHRGNRQAWRLCFCEYVIVATNENSRRGGSGVDVNGRWGGRGGDRVD